MSHSNQTICKVSPNSGAGNYPLNEQAQDLNGGTVKGDRIMYTNRYKHLTLASIALVVALIICPFLRINAVLAQEPSELDSDCGVLSVDPLNQNELEPIDPARFNRDEVLPQGRDLDSLDHPMMPEWEETRNPCPQWEELEVLSN